MITKELKVGDKLILEDETYKNNIINWVTVTKIGRKYFYVKSDQYSRELGFELETWKSKDDNYWLKIYPNVEVLTKKYIEDEATTILRRLFSSYNSLHCSAENLAKAIEALGFKKELDQKIEAKLKDIKLKDVH